MLPRSLQMLIGAFDGVEREQAETPALGRCHSHNHSVPIVRVTRVSGAPTLK
jgi:hypothetical protein